ncbi:hypothetical protein BCR37DRAFT_389575 [Protomyces lactucae-debilis]|uniref:Uncharacterized protein n=1 Tax=Protomyces lactucae-debilis TaxID=2754530 RepID=A0A1Y2EW09_PROLT|nr:uncharacterized protein BCR37DRAFT_389575 [Protomyces lactucae-debilis]ORY75748.1 hypothetical protein BCR37DRAFT_389575 [Protomyces lactucae-debilis]
MQVLSFVNLIVFLRFASAVVVTQPPPLKCNADNCLRGLFGANAKASAANMAACSTGLSTVTVSISGSVTTTMTATAPPPAAATVCDGQGVEKRAQRFSSACSCVGVIPVTTTTSVAAAPSSSLDLIALGQIASADTIQLCGGSVYLVQIKRKSMGNSYTVPQAGTIISATTYDGYATTFDGHQASQTFQVWRPAGTNQFDLVGSSQPLVLTGSGQVASFVLDQPIAVLEGDLLGAFAYGGACLQRSDGDPHDERYLSSFYLNGAEAPVGTRIQTTTFTNNNLVNVAAVLKTSA